MPEKQLLHQKYHFVQIFPSIALFGLASQSVVKEVLPQLGHTFGEYSPYISIFGRELIVDFFNQPVPVDMPDFALFSHLRCQE
jgi:hypothetical protein